VFYILNKLLDATFSSETHTKKYMLGKFCDGDENQYLY